MKKFALAAVLAVAGLPALAQDAAIGIWQTEVDDGRFAMVNMYQCGSAVCGDITRSFMADGTEYDSPNNGKKLVIDMVPQGGGAYEGSVWRPSNDKIYIGKMQVNGNALSLKGCVAGGMICANQNWKRLQ
ncbi:MAG: DUF2147 domain-containing protein [Pseudomonadota bacterium]|nr:DUF2147 domain-containing protein [Pseudomonadota bacterium]